MNRSIWAHKRAVPIWAVPAVSVLMLVSGAPPAAAAEPWERGNRRGVTVRDSKIVISGNGAAGSATVDADVPDCWYEPQVKAMDMPAWMNDKFQSDRRAGVPMPDQEEITKNQKKDGMWWMPAYMDTAAGLSCAEDLQPWVFVETGEPPPPGPAIDPATLARIARAYLEAPAPQVALNPDARSYVELGTWVWAEGGVPGSRSVTASLPGGPSATVVATPGDLSIEPGTAAGADATVHGPCGPAGTAYEKRFAKRTPPCGVTYHRSSRAVGVYTMEVSQTWAVEWVDTGTPMTPVIVGATRDVEVDEIQTRNEGG